MDTKITSGGASSGRRMLATVVFVDIVGYSILMATDETRTIARWIAILNEVIRPKAAQHGGTVVKSTGDGVLAMFSSVLDAVEWAQAVQASVNAAGEAPQISLRVAIHLSDVVVSDDDIYGDGVNVAARLQEFAAPGGIVMSEVVYDLVRGTAGARAVDLGLQQLKNFEKPVRIYSLGPDIPSIAAPSLLKRSSLPSIAILPLENLGPGGTEDYFADGLVEDIVMSLAGLGELFVISRGTTLMFRNRRADPREVGKALGVRYVLLGSVRMSPRLIRVTTQLCDASTGGNLWSETTETAPGELFDVQDRIVARIVAGIAPNVRAAELRAAMRKRPESFTAYDHTLRALHAINHLDRDLFSQARTFLAKAMEDDPSFAMPFAWAAFWHLVNFGQGWSSDPDHDISQAGHLASRAIELDQQNALALSIYGHVKSFLFHQYDVATFYLEQALAACPNSPMAWMLSSATLAYLGRGEQAVRHAEHALRLSPFDRFPFSRNIMCIAHYANGAYDEAVKWGRLSLSEHPSFSANHRFLIASLMAAGQPDEARQVARELMRLEPQFRLGVWERTRQPFRDPEIKAKHIDRLRQAGLPE